MCGRYAASRNPDDLVEEFEVVEGPVRVLEPDWNVAPTKEVFELYGKGGSDTEFHEFEGKGHSLTIDSGWREVAEEEQVGGRLLRRQGGDGEGEVEGDDLAAARDDGRGAPDGGGRWWCAGCCCCRTPSSPRSCSTSGARTDASFG